MLALLLLCLAGTLLVAVGMPVVLWSLSMETLRERAALAASPPSTKPRLAHSRRGPSFDTLVSRAA